MACIYTILYMLGIVLCNTIFTFVPNFHLFGMEFSVGDFLVGGIYVLRDLAQREIKHYVILAMLIGGLLSYLMADKAIAVASITAFLVGETIDWLIYTITKKPLSQRLLLSSSISTPIDTYVFLQMANRLDWLNFTFVISSKIIGVLALWFSWRVRQSSETIYSREDKNVA